MNRIAPLAAAALSVAAFAVHAEPVAPLAAFPAAESTLTRAQVQAELAAYRKAGVNPWSTFQYPPVGIATARSGATPANAAADAAAQTAGPSQPAAAATPAQHAQVR